MPASGWNRTVHLIVDSETLRGDAYVEEEARTRPDDVVSIVVIRIGC